MSRPSLIHDVALLAARIAASGTSLFGAGWRYEATPTGAIVSTSPAGQARELIEGQRLWLKAGELRGER